MSVRTGFLALVALSLWDALATRWGLATGAYAAEANPLMALVIHDVWATLAVKAAGMAPYGVLCWRRPDHRWVRGGLAVLLGVYAGLAVAHAALLVLCPT